MKTTPLIVFPCFLLVETVCDKLHYVPDEGAERGKNGSEGDCERRGAEIVGEREREVQKNGDCRRRELDKN